MKLNVKTTCITLAILICALFAVRAVTISLEGEKGYLKRTIYKIKRLAESSRECGSLSAGYASHETSRNAGSHSD